MGDARSLLVDFIDFGLGVELPENALKDPRLLSRHEFILRDAIR